MIRVTQLKKLNEREWEGECRKAISMDSWSPGKTLKSPLHARSPGLGLAAVSSQLLCRFPCGLHRGAGRTRHLGRVLPCTRLGSEGCWQAASLFFLFVRQGQFWLPSQLQLFLPAGINYSGPVPSQKQLRSASGYCNFLS